MRKNRIKLIKTLKNFNNLNNVHCTSPRPEPEKFPFKQLSKFKFGERIYCELEFSNGKSKTHLTGPWSAAAATSNTLMGAQNRLKAHRP